MQSKLWIKQRSETGYTVTYEDDYYSTPASDDNSLQLIPGTLYEIEKAYTHCTNNANEEVLKRTGQKLFNTLLSASVQRCLRKKSGGSLALHCEGNSINWPWEILFDNESFLGKKFAVSRFIPGETSHGRINRFSQKLTSVTGCTPEIQIARNHITNLMNFLESQKWALELRWDNPNIDDFRKYCFKTSVLYFTGHGILDHSINNRSGLKLNNNENGFLSCKYIEDIDIPAPFLIFVNACSSGDLHDTTNSIASAFLKAGVMAYIGCTTPVIDEYAYNMAERFFTYLSQKESFAESLRLARADMDGSMWGTYQLFGDPEAPKKGDYSCEEGQSISQLSINPTFEEFAQNCNKETHRKLNKIINWKYIPDDLYIERKEFERKVDDFIRSNSSEQSEEMGLPENDRESIQFMHTSEKNKPKELETALLITAGPGQGKSALMCRFAAKYSRLEKSNSQIPAAVVYLDLSYSSRSVWEHTMDHFEEYDDNIENFDTLLRKIGRLFTSPMLLIFLIDAVEDSKRPVDVLSELEELIEQCNSYNSRNKTGHRIKIIISIRNTCYDILVNRFDRQTERSSSNFELANYQLVLPEFSSEESKKAFDSAAARKADELNIEKKCTWQHLSAPLKKQLKLPLNLTLYLRIFSPDIIPNFSDEIILSKEKFKYAISILKEDGSIEIIKPIEKFILECLLPVCEQFGTIQITKDVKEAINRKSEEKKIKNCWNDLLSRKIIKEDCNSYPDKKEVYEFAHPNYAEHAFVLYLEHWCNGRNFKGNWIKFFENKLKNEIALKEIETAIQIIIQDQLLQGEYKIWNHMLQYYNNNTWSILFHRSISFLFYQWPGDLPLQKWISQINLNLRTYREGLSKVYGKLSIRFEKIKDRSKAIEFKINAIELIEHLSNEHFNSNVYKEQLSKFYLELNELYKVTGNYTESRKCVEKCLEIREALFNKEQENLEYKNNLAYAYAILSLRLDKEGGKLEEAIRFRNENLKILKELDEKFPENPEYQDNLGITYSNLSFLYKKKGERETAIGYREKNLAIVTRLSEDYQENIKYQSRLPYTYEDYSLFFEEDGNLKVAIRFQNKSLEKRKLLVEKDPENFKYQFGLTFTYEGLSRLFKKKGNIKKAIEFQNESLKKCRELVEKDPGNVEYQNRLAAITSGLSELYQDSDSISCTADF